MADPNSLMRHALNLARRGRGFVEPNPMVGAVVVSADGKLVGDGWHERFGGPHAEVNALAAAGESARGGTLFVTLEPCCHTGKTPPCTEAILKAGIRRVVCAMGDPFPQVDGGGFSILRDAGLEIIEGVGQSDAEFLNAPYRKLIGTGRPWVIAKWAMSLDGKIATRNGDAKWISGEESRRHAHETRGRIDAIVVGAETVRTDDPLLTARPAGPRTAMRIIVTASGELPVDCQLYATIRQAPVLIATNGSATGSLADWQSAGADVLRFPDGPLLLPLLNELGRRRMTNVLVEGGARLLGAFFDEQLVDEVNIYVAPKIIGGADALSPVGGIGLDLVRNAFALTPLSAEPLGGDILLTARRA